MRRFLGALAMALLSAWLALPAAAQVGLTGGGARDFIKLNGDWQELGAPLVGIAYDIPLNEDADRGLTFGFRASQDGELIQDYTIEAWRVWSYLEMFGGAEAVLLDQNFLGEYKLLGGLRGGFRFDAAGLPFELSGHWAYRASDLQMAGVFFGLRDTIGGEK